MQRGQRLGAGQGLQIKAGGGREMWGGDKGRPSNTFQWPPDRQPEDWGPQPHLWRLKTGGVTVLGWGRCCPHPTLHSPVGSDAGVQALFLTLPDTSKNEGGEPLPVSEGGSERTGRLPSRRAQQGTDPWTSWADLVTAGGQGLTAGGSRRESRVSSAGRAAVPPPRRSGLFPAL